MARECGQGRWGQGYMIMINPASPVHPVRILHSRSSTLLPQPCLLCWGICCSLAKAILLLGPTPPSSLSLFQEVFQCGLGRSEPGLPGTVAWPYCWQFLSVSPFQHLLHEGTWGFQFFPASY